MANLNCLPVQDLTTHSATISGTGDFIPVNHFLRNAYGVTSGGPYNTFGAPVAGTNSPGQVVSDNITNLLPDTTYYYVTQELDVDGITILGESGQCQFHTLTYNTTCELVAFSETSVTVKVCADYVAPDQTLDFIYGNTPGGPYPNNGGSVPGQDIKGQCATFTLNLAPCEIIYYRGSVTNVPAIYEIDWAYAHAPTPNTIFGNLSPQTVELRIGPESDYPANQTLVDTDSVLMPSEDGIWHHRSGTYPVPLNVTTLHMGFVSTAPAVPPSGGNMMDSCSIILRRVLPNPVVIGEQLINGSFEVPVVPTGGSFTLVPEGTPGLAWQTTAPDNLFEFWPTNNIPYSSLDADTGTQYVELNANFPSELYQVVPLAVATADSTECVASTFDLDCLPATNIDCDSATLNAQYCGLPQNYSVQFQYSTALGGPFFDAGPVLFVPSLSGVDSPVFTGSSSLQPNTTYYYRLVARDKQQNIIGTSETCSFTTSNCVSWCGGYFDPNTCLFVSTPDGGYFNCNQV